MHAIRRDFDWLIVGWVGLDDGGKGGRGGGGEEDGREGGRKRESRVERG